MDVTSAGGVVSVGISVLPWVWVAGLSGVDATIMLIGALEVTGVSLTSTNCDRQSAALLWAPDIHSKVKLLCRFQVPSVYFIVSIFTI